ncbi:MAG: PA-phosphatase [Cyclobacteriaceae bacterium]|nr:PA-phosphatase [Cyclobacteriaceae bacterium]
MRKFPAKIISYAFHPLMMPTYLFIIIILYLPDALQPMSVKVMLYVLLLIFITTFMIPLFSLLGLRTALNISSLHLEKRKERILPFSFITLFYGLTTYLFHTKIEVNDFLLSILLGATVVVGIVTIVTVFYKISVHAAGVGCMLGSMLAMIYRFPTHHLLWQFCMITLLAGIILSARLSLKAHTNSEVYAGFGLGFAACFLSVYLLA